MYLLLVSSWFPILQKPAVLMIIDWEPIQEQPPLSPNSQALAQYDNYMHRELPSLFRSRVEEVVRQEMQPVEARLLGSLDLVGLLRECQDQLSRTYPTVNGAEGQHHSPVMSSTGIPTDSVDTPEKAIEVPGTAHDCSEQNDAPAVLQYPPFKENEYSELDFSVLNEEFSVYHAPNPASISDDSGYSSGQLCICRDTCSCQLSMVNSANRYVDFRDQHFVPVPLDLQIRDPCFQWQDDPEGGVPGFEEH